MSNEMPVTFWPQIPRQVSAPDQKEVSTTLRWSLHCVPSLVEILDQLLRHCPQSATGGSWPGSPVQTQVLPQGMPYCVVTNWGIDQSETVFASQRSLAAKLSRCQSLLAIPGKAARLMLPGDKCSYPNLWQQGKPDLLSCTAVTMSHERRS